VTTTPAPPESLFTHIALPVRDLDEVLAFYAKYTTLALIHERYEEATGLRSVWLANSRDKTEAAARFVLVLICGSLPGQITGDIKEEYGFLTSISHLGISLNTREEVDHIAEMAKADGILVLGPRYMNPVVGYICLIRDPDGNQLEFSVEQELG
jgi:lactoylglutathione lyase